MKATPGRAAYVSLVTGCCPTFLTSVPTDRAFLARKTFMAMGEKSHPSPNLERWVLNTDKGRDALDSLMSIFGNIAGQIVCEILTESGGSQPSVTDYETWLMRLLTSQNIELIIGVDGEEVTYYSSSTTLERVHFTLQNPFASLTSDGKADVNITRMRRRDVRSKWRLAGSCRLSYDDNIADIGVLWESGLAGVYAAWLCGVDMALKRGNEGCGDLFHNKASKFYGFYPMQQGRTSISTFASELLKEVWRSSLISTGPQLQKTRLYASIQSKLNPQESHIMAQSKTSKTQEPKTTETKTVPLKIVNPAKDKKTTTPPTAKKQVQRKTLSIAIPNANLGGDLSDPYLVTITIKDYIQMIVDGIIEVPLYQRGKVWKAADNETLIADILQTPSGAPFTTNFLTCGIAGEDKGDPDIANIKDKGGMLQIDGLQRSVALRLFIEDKLSVPIQSFHWLTGADQERLEMAAGTLQVRNIRMSNLLEEDKEKFLSTKLHMVVRYGHTIRLAHLFASLNRGRPLLTSEQLFSPFMFGERPYEMLQRLATSNVLLRAVFSASGRVAGGEATQQERQSVERGLLNLCAIMIGCYSGTPGIDYLKTAAYMKANDNDETVERIETLITGLLSFVLEGGVDAEEKEFSTIGVDNILYRMASPVSGRYTAKPVLFLHIAETFIKVVTAYATAKGIPLKLENADKIYEWLLPQRATIAQVITGIKQNKVPGTKVPIVMASTGVADAAIVEMPHVALPEMTEEEMSHFAIEYGLYNTGERYYTYEFMANGFLDPTLQSDYDAAGETLEAIREALSELHSGREATELTVLSDLYSKVSRNTNGPLVHRALSIYLPLFLFGIVVNKSTL